jgi:hypothetical protein
MHLDICIDFSLLYRVFFIEWHTRYNIIHYVLNVYVYQVRPLNTQYFITICTECFENTRYSTLPSVFLYQVSPLSTRYTKILCIECLCLSHSL